MALFDVFGFNPFFAAGAGIVAKGQGISKSGPIRATRTETVPELSGLPFSVQILLQSLKLGPQPGDDQTTVPIVYGDSLPPVLPGVPRGDLDVAALGRKFLPGARDPTESARRLPRISVGIYSQILKGILKRVPKPRRVPRSPRRRPETEVERRAREARERARGRVPRRGRIDLPRGPEASPPVVGAPAPQVPPEIAPEVTRPGQLPNVRTSPDIGQPPRPITQAPKPRPAPKLSGGQAAALALGAAVGTAVLPALLAAPAAAAAGLAFVPGNPALQPLAPTPVTGPLGRIDLSAQLGQQAQQQQKRRRCEKTRRKNRKTCWKGFYRESTSKTKFEKWYRVDCKTGRQLGAKQQPKKRPKLRVVK